MSNFAKNAWCFFLVFLYFGIWTIPVLIGVVLIFMLIYHYKPHWLEK